MTEDREKTNVDPSADAEPAYSRNATPIRRPLTLGRPARTIPTLEPTEIEREHRNMGRRNPRASRQARPPQVGVHYPGAPSLRPDGAGEILVRIRGLRFARGERRIFDGVDLDIRRGAVTAILGPSGSGKTTLLKLVCALLRPDAGEVEVDGRSVHSLGRRELYRLRTGMGMLFQGNALLTDLSVFDNVAFPLREHTDLPESMLRKLVLLKLEAVGLRGARDLMPSELSGGMARRVALARAIALDPTLVLYDEPFTGQDPISLGVLATLIRHLNDAGRLTSILVSHDVEETMAIADHLYLLADGKVMARGTPEQVRADRSRWVVQFLRGLPDGPVHFHYPAPRLEQDLLG